jgi:hypothetical protein
LLQLMGVPFRISVAVAVLMATQSLLGLAFADQYRDTGWIRATWFGNDWITLVLAVPLLVTGLLLSRRHSMRGLLLWLGVLGYGVYNFAFYMLGAALNVFFLLYVLAFLSSAVALILALSRISVPQVAQRFRVSTPVRMIGGYYALVAAGLASVWIVTWAAYAFAGRPTPIEEAAFRLVAALDLALMVPALASGGVLLWRRSPWGYVISAIAGIQGSLYLVVLSVNSVVAIDRGFSEAPGELPLWGTLALGTVIATGALLANVRSAGVRV